MRFLAFLLTGIFVGSPGCSSLKLFRSGPPIPQDQAQKIQTLQATIQEREVLCARWAASVPTMRVRDAIRNYPGTTPEGMELGMIFMSAPNTPGFPKDYRWNWTTSAPMNTQNCRLMTWFGLTKGSAGADEQIRQQIMAESRRNLFLTRHLIHMSVVKSMLEKKRLKMKPQVLKEFNVLDVATNSLRQRMREQTPEKRLSSQCRNWTDPRTLDCPSEVEAELYDFYGQAYQTEYRETAGLSERLAALLYQAKVKKH